MFSVVAVHATCANTPLFHLFWDGNKIDFLILIKTTGPVFLDTCIQLEHKEGRGVCGPSVFLICCFYLRLIFSPKPSAYLSSDGEQTAVPLEHSFRLLQSMFHQHLIGIIKNSGKCTCVIKIEHLNCWLMVTAAVVEREK